HEQASIEPVGMRLPVYVGLNLALANLVAVSNELGLELGSGHGTLLLSVSRRTRVSFGARPGDSERCQTPTVRRAPSRPRAGRDRFHRARDARTVRSSRAGGQSPGRHRPVGARRAKIAPVKIGVTIPNNWGIDNPRQVLALGPLAEALGYDSIWVMDHLLNC